MKVMKVIRLPVTFPVLRHGFYQAIFDDGRMIEGIHKHGPGWYWIEWADYWKGVSVDEAAKKATESLTSESVYKGDFRPFQYYTQRDPLENQK